jgi:transposase-like protein
VQTDEAYVGGMKSGPRGRGAEGKSLVLIMVQDKEGKVGRIRLARVADASSASLVPAVSAAVAPGSTIATDGWAGYEGLSKAGCTRVIA